MSVNVQSPFISGRTWQIQVVLVFLLQVKENNASLWKEMKIWCRNKGIPYRAQRLVYIWPRKGVWSGRGKPSLCVSFSFLSSLISHQLFSSSAFPIYFYFFRVWLFFSSWTLLCQDSYYTLLSYIKVTSGKSWAGFWVEPFHMRWNGQEGIWPYRSVRLRGGTP